MEIDWALKVIIDLKVCEDFVFAIKQIAVAISNVTEAKVLFTCTIYSHFKSKIH